MIKSQKLDLRVILSDGARFAVYFSVALRGRDIYTASGRLGRQDLFRHSYHAFGRSHLKLLGRQVSQTQLPEPDKISSPVQVSAGSGDIYSLSWRESFKRDSATRRNIVLDVKILKDLGGGVTAEIWALPTDNTSAVDVLQAYREKARVLGELRVDWTSPPLLMFVWTLTPEGWAAAHRAMSV